MTIVPAEAVGKHTCHETLSFPHDHSPIHQENPSIHQSHLTAALKLNHGASRMIKKFPSSASCRLPKMFQ
jgi:hypothetical protein